LHLIEQADQMMIMVSILTEPSLIRALNRAAKRGARIQVLLDSNHYMFDLRLPYMPNVIAVKDLHKDIQVRMHYTQYQLHAKSAQFTQDSGEHFTWINSANWVEGGFNRYAWNEAGVLLYNDHDVAAKFENDFIREWAGSTDRSGLCIPNIPYKYYLSKIFLKSGFCGW